MFRARNHRKADGSPGLHKARIRDLCAEGGQDASCRGGADAIKAFASRLRTGKDAERAHAARVLGSTLSLDAIPPLLKSCLRGSDEVKEASADALSMVLSRRPKEALAMLSSCLKSLEAQDLDELEPLIRPICPGAGRAIDEAIDAYFREIFRV